MAGKARPRTRRRIEPSTLVILVLGALAFGLILREVPEGNMDMLSGIVRGLLEYLSQLSGGNT